MASVKNSFGLGGGSSKTRLVADLNDEYKKLNTTLKETEKLSKSIAGSLKGSSSGGNRGGASSMSEPTPPPAGPAGPAGPSAPSGPRGPSGPGAPGGPGGGGVSGFSYGSALRSMAGSAVDALTQGVDASNYITNDIARRRFGFFSGVYSRQNDNIGTIAGAKAFASMSSRGTPTSAMDAANATMAGNSMGLMSGLKNYNTIVNSTAGISNVMPGVGLEGGMGAVAALNQGSSVNQLRMIGINVRDQNGFMRNVEDIARDLWKSLNTNKSGMSKITEADLSFSLQPGNSVDMLLNQYFGSDAVLRQAIVSYLFQFAKNNGAKVGAGYQSTEGKKELLTTGANPGITQSIGTRNQLGQANINAYTTGGILGIQSANDTINNFTKMATALSPVLQAFVTATTFTQTLTSAGNGAGGIITKDLLEGASGAATATINAVKPFLKSPAALAIFGAMWATLSGISAVQQQQDEYLADLIAQGKADPNTKGTNSVSAKMDQVLANDPGLAAFLGNPTSYDLSGTGTVATITPGASPSFPSGGTPGTSTPGAKPTQAQIKAAKIAKVRAANPNLDAGGWFNKKAKSSSWDWSKKFLASIGQKNPTSEHIAAVQEWLMHENTASSDYLGTRNNPLNTKWDMGDSLGTDLVGMTGYATEEEGIQAAATTLLKGNSSYGYGQIVDKLKDPNATEEQIWAAISASKWSGSNYGAQAGTGRFTNMAGATININIPNAANMDPKQLAAAIAEVLSDQGQTDEARR